MASTPERHSGSESREDVERFADLAETRQASLLFDGILEAVPTTFAKLVTMAGLRVKGSSAYGHPQLNAFRPDVVTRVLQKRHEKVFADWLNLGLEEQHKQLTEFFCTMWTQGTPRLPVAVRQTLVPTTACEAERQLFLADLECTLSVMEIR